MNLLYWLYKNLIWYFVVTISFTMIITYPDNLLMILLVSGVLTFGLIIWWRSSFEAFLNMKFPYDDDLKV